MLLCKASQINQSDNLNRLKVTFKFEFFLLGHEGEKNLLDKFKMSFDPLVQFCCNFKYNIIKKFQHHLMCWTKALKSKAADILAGPRIKEMALKT